MASTTAGSGTQVGVLTTYSATKQLSDGNGVGTVLGQSPADLISFFGAPPVAQPSGPGETALTRGQSGAVIATFNSATKSPTAVQPTITAEQALATFISATSNITIAAGDLLYLIKPTSQAGLGVGNVRVSAANSVGVTFSNFTATTITPTATQSYGLVALRGVPTIAAVLTPAAVAPNSIVEQQFTVPGLRSGAKSLVQVSKPTSQANIDIMGVRVVADNLLGITFGNVTATTTTPTAAESYTVFAMGGLDALSNVVLYEASIGAALAAGIATITTGEIAGITLTGLAVTDNVIGVTKPTVQAGLGIAGWRVSAANTLAVTFVNPTVATLTPTASEVYGVSVYRPAPVAPLVVYNQTLTPVAVAANTTAEQTFTVTGLVAGSPVWVNKPSWTQGLGVVGCRVSAANTLAINYGNCTAASITPPAEAYVIGNFQVPIPDAGNAVVMGISNADQSQAVLVNTIRAAMVSLGLVAGA